MAYTYTYSAIKTEVMENIGYDDGAGAMLTGKDVTEAIVGKAVNQAYYDLVTILANKYPEDYEVSSKATTFYKTTGTVTSVSTTTLNASITGSFNTAMEGDTIYNSTQAATAVIDYYVSATQVIMKTSVADWDASDTLYILGHEFIVGGDAAQSRYITDVEVKYSSTATNFTTCRKVNKNETYKEGDEFYSTAAPRWYKTTILDSTGILQPAIGVLPEPTVNVDRGLRLKYVWLPSKLSADGDLPELPIGSQHLLISGGTIKVLRKLRRLDEIPEFKDEYERGKLEMVANYAHSKVLPPRGDGASHWFNLRMRNK